MAVSGAELKGFKEFEIWAGEIEARLRRKGKGSEVDRVLHSAADPIMEAMRKQASKDPAMRSGDLHDAIKARRARSRPEQIKITVGVHREDWNNEDYYPAYVEFGHGGPGPAPAHPFVRPAFDIYRDEAYEAIRRGLKELTQKIDK